MCLECFTSMRCEHLTGLSVICRFVDYHHFRVISTVFLLHWVELLGEESKGLPGILHALLQYGSYGGC